MTKNEALELAIKGIILLGIDRLERVVQEKLREPEFAQFAQERWNYYQQAIVILEGLKDDITTDKNRL